MLHTCNQVGAAEQALQRLEHEAAGLRGRSGHLEGVIKVVCFASSTETRLSFEMSNRKGEGHWIVTREQL
jgi:cytochrome oxidase assembly protein ShyY1